jgi:hypothetical protein
MRDKELRGVEPQRRFRCCALSYWLQLSSVRTFCRRAAPDAPECIDRRRRCTGRHRRTCCGGSRGSASLPATRADTPNTPTRRPADTSLLPPRRPADTPTRRHVSSPHADPPIRRPADTSLLPPRRPADTPTRRYVSSPPTPTRRYADPPIRLSPHSCACTAFNSLSARV